MLKRKVIYNMKTSETLFKFAEAREGISDLTRFNLIYFVVDSIHYDIVES